MAETRVTGPDGGVIVFPEGMDDSQITAALKSIYPPPAPPAASDALTMMPGLQRQPMPGPTIADTARGVIPGFAQSLSATLQGTTPTVRRLDGKMKYAVSYTHLRA